MPTASPTRACLSVRWWPMGWGCRWKRSGSPSTRPIASCWCATACIPTGHPLRPLVWLANYLASHGTGLTAKQVVTTGSYCGMVDVPLDTPLVVRLAISPRCPCIHSRKSSAVSLAGSGRGLHLARSRFPKPSTSSISGTTASICPSAWPSPAFGAAGALSPWRERRRISTCTRPTTPRCSAAGIISSGSIAPTAWTRRVVASFRRRIAFDLPRGLQRRRRRRRLHADAALRRRRRRGRRERAMRCAGVAAAARRSQGDRRRASLPRRRSDQQDRDRRKSARSEATAIPGWIVLIEGTSEIDVRGAGESLTADLRALPGMPAPAIDTSTYQLQHALSKAP